MSAVDLSGVITAFKRKPGDGRAIMFISAGAGEGVSPLVRQAVKLLQPCYAVDLDVRRNGLARSLVAEGATLSPPVESEFGGGALFEAVDIQKRVLPLEQPIFAFHRLSLSKIYVGAFNHKALPQGARVRVCDAPKFWNGARKSGATMLVDAPALARSKIGLVVAKRLDGVVLVVGDGEGAAPAAMAAKDALVAAGATLLGLVYTSAPAKPAPALKRAS